MLCQHKLCPTRVMQIKPAHSKKRQPPPFRLNAASLYNKKRFSSLFGTFFFRNRKKKYTSHHGHFLTKVGPCVIIKPYKIPTLRFFLRDRGAISTAFFKTERVFLRISVPWDGFFCFILRRHYGNKSCGYEYDCRKRRSG